MFKNFFYDKKAVESIEKDLVENIIPEDESAPRIAINTTELKIHVSYDPAVDDIKMFADYIMDLDETQHAFYFLYTYEVSRRKFVKGIIGEYNKIKHRFEEIEEDIKKLSEKSTEQEKHNVELKERYLKQVIVRDILKASSGSKTNFMYSVIMNDCVETMEPDYIRGGLEWLMS